VSEHRWIHARRLRAAVAGAALLLTASGCSSFHGLQGTDGKDYVSGDGAVHQIAPADRGDPIDFDGEDLDGRALSLSAMRGRPAVIPVWWANCPPCRAEAPLLVAAHRQLGDKAHFVGIDVRDSGKAGHKAFQEQFHVTWPSFYSPGGESLLAFPGTLTPNSIPATVVLDAQGRVAASIIGALPSRLTLVQIVHQVARGG
jgi:thiol-disulfide isomerase/thioredoxin